MSDLLINNPKAIREIVVTCNRVKIHFQDVNNYGMSEVDLDNSYVVSKEENVSLVASFEMANK